MKRIFAIIAILLLATTAHAATLISCPGAPSGETCTVSLTSTTVASPPVTTTLLTSQACTEGADPAAHGKSNYVAYYSSDLSPNLFYTVYCYCSSPTVLNWEYTITQNETRIDTNIASRSTFNPASDTVANVTTVGSVTGAVGSVTGNVGGSVASVTGAVGSVTNPVSVTGDLSATMKASVTTAATAATPTVTLTSAYDAAKTAAQASTALTNATWTDAKAAYLDASISSRGTSSFNPALDNVTVGTITSSAAQTVSTKTWSEALPGSYISGQAGYKLNSASAAGDPWSTTAGGYASGTYGQLVYDYLNASVAAIKSQTDQLVFTSGRVNSSPDSSAVASAVDTQLSGTHGAGSWTGSASGSTDWTDTERAQIRYRLGLDGTTATPTSTTIGLLSGDVEGTYTWGGLVRLMASALFGKSSGGGTTTIKFRDLQDTKDRITATQDSKGNRTAVTLDGN